MRDQGNHAETGRVDYRRCEVERAETKHREESCGLWRCVSCGFAAGEDFRCACKDSDPELAVLLQSMDGYRARKRASMLAPVRGTHD